MEWLIISYVNNLWASFFFFLLFTQINSFTPMFYRYISRELEGNYEPLRIIFIRLFFAGVIKASARDRAQSWDWGATSELRASRSARCPFLLHCSLFVFNSPQQRADPLLFFFFASPLSPLSRFTMFPESWKRYKNESYQLSPRRAIIARARSSNGDNSRDGIFDYHMQTGGGNAILNVQTMQTFAWLICLRSGYPG